MKTWEQRRDEDRESRRHYSVGMGWAMVFGGTYVMVVNLFLLQMFGRSYWILVGIPATVTLGYFCGHRYSKVWRDRLSEWRFMRAARK